MRDAVSVSILMRYIKSRIDVDPKLASVRIKGEISNFVAHRSGHYYFSLKDESARISCVMFASKVSRCTLSLKDGMGVIVNGSISVYENSGSIQIYVNTVEEDGIGDLYKKYEELKARMIVEGLFDPSCKKPIPAYPFKIGVLSAKEGAATQDVITTIRRRWPIAQIHFYPTFVQGQAAASDIVENLQLADQENYDVILLVRGGGSIEDLWAFNMEEVVRAIYHCHTPIITGVGHETDTTLVDYVSDQRAPTPTAAAELATPNLVDVEMNLKKQSSLLVSRLQQIRSLKQQRFKQLSQHPYIVDPSLKVRDKLNTLSLLDQRLWQFPAYYKARNMQYTLIKQRFEQSGRHLLNTQQNTISMCKQQLQNHIKSIYQNKASKFQQSILLLDAYSPLQLLQKGYTLTYINNTMVKSIKQLHNNDQITVRFADGTAHAQINGLEAKIDGRE